MFCCAPAVNQDAVLVDTEAVAAQEKTQEEPKVEESAKCFEEAPEEPAPEPAQPLEVLPRTFEAAIKRVEGNKFGSQCTKWTDRVEVAKVAEGGDLEEYNKGAAEDVQVKAGDFIVKVKFVGQTEEDVRQQIPQAMVDALKTGGDLIVNVVKPFRFDVEVTKDGPLGLQLQYTNQFAGIVVGDVKDGPFKAYNDALDETERKRVKAKDCIDLVNGERTQTGAELADKIKGTEKGSNVKISFIRFADA